MSAVGRAAARLAVVVSLLMLLCLSIVIAGYVRRSGTMHGIDDWLIFLLPVFPPLVTILGWVAARWGSRPDSLLRGFLMGVACVSSAYILIPAVYLASQYRLVSADGTAYWGLLAMPAFWLWLPATTIAGVGGTIVAAVRAWYRQVSRRQGRG